ncbi:MAG: prepilin-type N-terminal cleavage/methylation domain-containing protein [bacterium]
MNWILRKLSNQQGFTLVEIIVVVAIIAILAGVLTPSIMKNINEAKITRATGDTKAIGTAISSFFVDVGRWPTERGEDAVLDDDLTLLYGGVGTAPTDDATSAGWVTATPVGNTEDTFENHLLTNTPKGQAVNVYPITGSIYWKGPYLPEIKSDPWGNYYSCNIQYIYGVAGNAVAVASAGPNRGYDTDFALSAAGASVSGDDIWYRLK